MDLKELAKSRNAKNVFCNRLGIQIRDIAPGRAVVVKTVGPEDVNPLGIPHGGVYFSMADTACGTAMATHGYAAVTMDANYHFLKSAAVGDTLTAESFEALRPHHRRIRCADHQSGRNPAGYRYVYLLPAGPEADGLSCFS